MNSKSQKRRTTGHPILPIEAYAWLYDQKGNAAAIEVLDRVQEGRYPVEAVFQAIEQGNVEHLLN